MCARVRTQGGTGGGAPGWVGTSYRGRGLGCSGPRLALRLVRAVPEAGTQDVIAESQSQPGYTWPGPGTGGTCRHSCVGRSREGEFDLL